MIEAASDTYSDFRVLLIEDDDIMRLSVEDRLQMENIPTVGVPNIADAQRHMRTGEIDLVVTDIRLPDGTGADLFHDISKNYPGTPVIVMTAYGSVPQAVELVKAGVSDYLIKPFDMETFISRVRRTLSKVCDERLSAEISGLDGTHFKPGSGVLGKSPAMRRIERLIQRIGKVDSTVLITGDSGVGKEVVATLIHRNGPRSGGPIVKVNCAAIPASLVESELFGHEKGAFTGADRQRIGRFEQAHGGTLFLDEIAEIPPETQVKLLRVIQERSLERLGSGTPIAVNVRIIAATQKNLEKAIEENTFRSDLFWRLNVVRIHIPPLCERSDDIHYLARLFTQKQAKDAGKEISGLSPEVEDYLLKQNYPGNVRELRNIIERALVLCDGKRIEMHDLLPFELELSDDKPQSLKDVVRDAETQAIQSALSRYEGAITEAAQSLGISRKNLWEKMKRYDISA